MTQQLLVGLLLSVVIAGFAYWRGSLSPSGAAAALVVGTLTFGLGGLAWGVLLAIFFVTSSVLSHFKEAEKRATADEKFAKGHRRDAGQVLANGGLGALLALLNTIVPATAVPREIWFYLFVGVMATVTADTWATELGTLSPRPPRLITNGRVVEAGTSGGVSPLGTGISLLGGLIIGLVAGLFSGGSIWVFTLAGALAGLAGSLFDSLLGATVQQIFYCDICQKETERKVHRGSHQTRPLRGWSWMNNDVVNLLSSVVGGIVAAALAVYLR
jgi:uncharacterized protein (TIGR00297 family)